MVINPLSINLRTKKPKFEVADVLRQYGDAYREQYPLTGEQARVMDNLMACRTAALGIHVDECSQCGALEFSYASCGDRHCPKCGKFKKASWVEKQKVVRLPIPYPSTSSGQAFTSSSPSTTWSINSCRPIGR